MMKTSYRVQLQYRFGNRIITVYENQTFVEFKCNVLALLKVEDKDITMTWSKYDSIVDIDSESEFEYVKETLRLLKSGDLIRNGPLKVTVSSNNDDIMCAKLAAVVVFIVVLYLVAFGFHLPVFKLKQ